MESIIITNKKCSKCSRILPIDRFSKDSRTSTGLQSRCKECHAAYYQENRSKIRASGNSWYQEHRFEILEKQRTRNLENPETKREVRRRAYLKNKEAELESNAKWRQDNPLRWKAIRRNAESRRRARKLDQDCGCVSLDFLSEILNSTCVYCGDAAEHVDHVKPLALGGKHCVSNLVASCARCNQSKREFTVEQFYKRTTSTGKTLLVSSEMQVLTLTNQCPRSK